LWSMYGLIAPVLQQQGVSVQIEYFREVARKEHDVRPYWQKEVPRWGH